MKILICTNGKKHSQEAINFAGNLFKALKPKITLFCVVTSAGKLNGRTVLRSGKKILKRLGLRNARSKLEKAKEISSTIIQEAKSGKYDLLVIGSRGISEIIPGVSQYILGEIPREIISEVNTSILIVKEPEHLDKILICVDNTPASKKSIEFWGKLEQKQRKLGKDWKEHRIVLLNVISEFYEKFGEILGPIAETQLMALESLPSKRTQYLYDAKEILKTYGVESRVRLREGDVVEEILRESDRDYDLIIMRKSGKKKQTIGHYVRRVVEDSKIPVLVIGK